MEDLLLEWPSKDECSNAEAALKAKLESMKWSRSGLLSFVTKLQNKLNCLLKDTALYNDALKKKQAFDETLLKCTEHSAAYVQAIPRNKADYHEAKLEAETKHVDLEMKKAKYDQNSRRMPNAVLTCKVQLARPVETHQVHLGNQ